MSVADFTDPQDPMMKQYSLYLIQCLAFGLLYYFAGEVGLLIDTGQPGVTTLWPPSGLTLLVFLFSGYRFWPGVYIGFGLLAYQNGIPTEMALISASGDTAEALLACYLLQKAGFTLNLNKVKEVSYFSLIAFLSPFISSTLGTMLMMTAMESSWSEFVFIWSMWWLGDAIGILLIVPLFLAWRKSLFGGYSLVVKLFKVNEGRKNTVITSEFKQALKSHLQLLFLILMLVVISWYSFMHQNIYLSARLAFFYLIMPLTVLAAILCAQKGASLATLVVSSILLYANHPVWGFFLIDDGYINIYLAIGFIAITAITSHMVAALFSERQEAEKSLRTSHAKLKENELRLRQLSENIKEVFWLTDANNFKVIYVSPSFEEIWGVSIEELLGNNDNWLKPIHKNDLIKVVDAYENFRTTGDFDVEYRILRKDGSIRWIHDKGFPVFDDNGNIYRWAGVAEDITERVLAEENSKKQQEEMARLTRYISLGELGTSLAHEISQPLASIVCYSQGALARLKAKKLSEDEMGDILQNLSTEANRAGEIVKKIRNFVNRKETRLSTVNVHDVIDDALKLIQGKIKDEKVNVHNRLVPDMPLIIADNVLLQQALLNIMINAIEAMEETPYTERKLMVTTDVNREHVFIKICDTGSGVSAELMDEIMKPLVTSKNEGIGLGLPISYSIIESMGGRLRGYANEPCGYCFEITLPLKNNSRT